jgi:hypothetical protein
MFFAPVLLTFNVAFAPTCPTLIFTYAPANKAKLFIPAVRAVVVPPAVANKLGSIKYYPSLVIVTV